MITLIDMMSADLVDVDMMDLVNDLMVVVNLMNVVDLMTLVDVMALTK